MSDDSTQAATPAEPPMPCDHGPGPFITHRTWRLPDGSHLVACSRRHRKGLRPHRVIDAAAVARPIAAHLHAFGHFWAPGRLAWWVAVLFMIGSSCFTVGGFAVAWPDHAPMALRDEGVLGRLFAIGAVFFTSAAFLQWLEALNGDVADAFEPGSRPSWRWIGWCPRNLGYLASTVQLVGTVMFNFNTLDATIADLDWVADDLLVWTPNMIGCACFLVASYLAYAEVSHAGGSVAPRSVSWWITVVNLAGSVAFQASAVYSFMGPGMQNAGDVFWANFLTAVGGLCFLVGAYLMIPELFDESPEPDAWPLADAGVSSKDAAKDAG
jgi:hypothetical protein